MIIAMSSVLKSFVFKTLSVHMENAKPAFLTSSGLKRVVVKLCFHDQLVGTVGLIMEMRLHLQISPVKSGHCLKYNDCHSDQSTSRKHPMTLKPRTYSLVLFILLID